MPKKENNSASSQDIKTPGNSGNSLGSNTNDEFRVGGVHVNVDLLPGDDLAIYSVSETPTTAVELDGGAGIDGLLIEFSRDQWLRDAVQQDVASYLQFLDQNINNNGQANGSEIELQSVALTARKIEFLRVTVDGVELTPQDDPVLAEDDAITSQHEHEVLTGDVTENDAIADLLRAVTLIEGPELGELELQANGQFSYNPGQIFDWLAAGETSQMSFTYEAVDANYDSDRASMVITVTGTNDAPVALADSGTTQENTSLLVDLLENDTDVDSSDTHTLDTVNIVVGQGSAAIINNQLEWTPGEDYDYLAVGETALVSITYQMSDNNSGTAESEFTLTVTGENDIPVANPESAETAENTSIVIDVLDNDTDLDKSDTHTVDVVTITAGEGSASISNNQLAWAPGTDYDYLAEGESATVTVAYQMSDNHQATADSVVTLTVVGENDVPVANADVAETEENTTVLIDVLENDTDLDRSNTHTLDSVSLLSGLGAVAISNNQLEWIAGEVYDFLAKDETAVVKVAYEISDNSGASASSEATLTVTGSNDAPEVAGALLSQSHEEDEPYLINLLDRASDVDQGAVLQVVASSVQERDQQGGWTLQGNNLLIDPDYFDDLNDGETGFLNFSFTITDEHQASVEQQLTVEVEGYTDAPYLFVRALAGSDVNEILLHVNVVPADQERVRLSFAGLPAGSKVFDASGTEIGTGLDFSGIGTFSVQLPENAVLDEVLEVSATGFKDNGEIRGASSQSLDISSSVSSFTDQLSFVAENNSMWASGSALTLGWHQYVPIIGGISQVWDDVNKVWQETDAAPWRGGQVNLLHASVNSEDIFQLAIAAPQAILDEAHETFEVASQAVDQAALAAFNAAQAAFEDAVEFGDQAALAAFQAAEDAFEWSVQTADQTLNDAFATARDVYDGAVAAAQAVLGAAWTVFSPIKSHNDHLYNTAKAQEASGDLIGAGLTWAAYGTYQAVYGPALLVWEAAEATFETARDVARDVLNGAESLARDIRDEAVAAAQATLDLAEQTYQAANSAFVAAAQAALDQARAAYEAAQAAIQSAAEAVLQEAENAFDTATDALREVEFNSELKVDAELFADVGLQIDFELDSGSVDSELDYTLTTAQQYNKTTDMLSLTPLMQNLTSGTTVAFSTISPNVAFYAAIIYDVGVDFEIFLDGNLAIAGQSVFDLSPGSNGVTLTPTVSTGWEIDPELEEYTEGLDRVQVGELVIVDLDSTDATPFAVPFIETLTQNIVNIELAVPTVETEGTATDYSPEFFEEGGFVSFNPDEITSTLLNLVTARLDLSPEIQERFGLSSLYEIDDLQQAFAELGDAVIKGIFDVLDGQFEKSPVFLIDATDETNTEVLHFNTFPDSVIADTLTEDTATFGFYTAYGESDNIVQVTIDIDAIIALIANKIVEAAAAGATAGTVGSILLALPDINPFNLTIGLDGILRVVQVPESVRDEITRFLDLEIGLEALDFDINTGLNFSQEFSLSVDDMNFLVTMEDGAQYEFAANTEGQLQIPDASQHDSNGDGVIDYSLSLSPDAMFSNDTELGLNVGYVIDFLQASFAAGINIPLGDLIDIDLPFDLPTLNVPMVDIGIGPLLRAQGDLDLASADVFEHRFDIDLGSDSTQSSVSIIDDVIYGTEGDDELQGLEGFDFLTGGTGNDQFLFLAGHGHDVITDFTAGAGSDDVLVLGELGFMSFEDVIAVANQQGNDTLLDFGNGDSVLLVGVSSNDLHQDDVVV
jgi:VCBS repeat-containing protein